MKPTPQTISAFVLAILLFSSCGPPPITEQFTETPSATKTPTSPLVPRITATTRPSATAIPSLIPVDLATIAPTETVSVDEESAWDDELPSDHPLSIENLRQREYPGSTINIEQELEPNELYWRYLVSYRSEGLRIYALMTIPEGDIPEDGWPVIIFNHGYIPPDIYRTTERYEAYVDELAQSGYIVFRPDYRGHGLSDGEARGAYGYTDYTIDVLNAVASIKKYEDADPDRIGMWGHSMGGYLTLRCMVISEDIKAGSIWAGVVAPYPDLVYNWPGQTYETPELANSWRTSLAAVYGSPSQNPAFWDSISANSYVTQLSGPVQLHHGTGDAEVPVAFSTALYQRLYNANLPSELYTYDNDNHNLSNYFDVAMERTIDFFDVYVKEAVE